MNTRRLTRFNSGTIKESPIWRFICGGVRKCSGNLLLVAIGDLLANRFGRTFDRLGGDVQTRQNLHRLATGRNRHLVAYHSFHASYAVRRLQINDAQFSVLPARIQ